MLKILYFTLQFFEQSGYPIDQLCSFLCRLFWQIKRVCNVNRVSNAVVRKESEKRRSRRKMMQNGGENRWLDGATISPRMWTPDSRQKEKRSHTQTDCYSASPLTLHCNCCYCTAFVHIASWILIRVSTFFLYQPIYSWYRLLCSEPDEIELEGGNLEGQEVSGLILITDW